MSDWELYFDELMSEECVCEKPKWKGFSFCYRCYKSLPKDMQKDLYKQIGQGYEEAYDNALKFLKTPF